MEQECGGDSPFPWQLSPFPPCRSPTRCSEEGMKAGVSPGELIQESLCSSGVPSASPKAPQGAAGWAKLLFHTEALLQGPEELVNCQLLIVIWMRQPQQWGLLGNISQALGEAAAISEVASRSRTTLGRGWDPQHLPVHCGARVVIPIYCVPIKHGITLNILK